MVESTFVDSTEPIGVLRAISQGFDRVAARPLLILPPLLLDLLLWLGPHIRITSLLDEMTGSLRRMGELFGSQTELLPTGFQTMVEQFNLASALSTLPVGIPSVMAGRMPLSSPVGAAPVFELVELPQVLLVWLLLSAAGLALGANYHLWIAATVAPEARLGSRWTAGLRIIGFGLLLLVGSIAAGASVLVAIGVAAIILPLLGVGVFYLGLLLLFWMAVYLVFTPHGIVRYNLGVFRAAFESFAVVRWNLLGTVGFLLLALGGYWLSNLVWGLPSDDSWFALLGVVGHAFVSTMLLAASYLFYQDRREWLVKLRQAAVVRNRQQ